MRACVYGAGAIGGHLAVRLAKGGADVSVIARGEHLAAIQANGLEVHAVDGVHKIKVQATDDPGTIGPVDAVFVTVKAPALPAVAAGIGPLLQPDTAVAFVMNGIPWWYFQHLGGPHDGHRLPRIDPGRRAAARGRAGSRDRWRGLLRQRRRSTPASSRSSSRKAASFSASRTARCRRAWRSGRPDHQGRHQRRGDDGNPHRDLEQADRQPRRRDAGGADRHARRRRSIPSRRRETAALRVMQEAAAIAQALGARPATNHDARIASQSGDGPQAEHPAGPGTRAADGDRWHVRCAAGAGADRRRVERRRWNCWWRCANSAAAGLGTLGRKRWKRGFLAGPGCGISILGFGCGAVGGLMVRGSAADQDTRDRRARWMPGSTISIRRCSTATVRRKPIWAGRLQPAKPAGIVVGTKVRSCRRRISAASRRR